MSKTETISALQLFLSQPIPATLSPTNQEITLTAFQGKVGGLVHLLEKLGELEPSLGQKAVELNETAGQNYIIFNNIMKGFFEGIEKKVGKKPFPFDSQAVEYHLLRGCGANYRRASDLCTTLADIFERNKSILLGEKKKDVEDIVHQHAVEIAGNRYSPPQSRIKAIIEQRADDVEELFSLQDPLAIESEMTAMLEGMHQKFIDYSKPIFMEKLVTAPDQLRKMAIVFTHLAERYEQEIAPLLLDSRGTDRPSTGFSAR